MTKPCAWFLTETGCKLGDECKYSHDINRICSYYKVQPCQMCKLRYTARSFCNQCQWLRTTKLCATVECENRVPFKHGDYCKACNEVYEADLIAKAAEMGVRYCRGYNCKAEIDVKGIAYGAKFCQSCKEIEKTYVIRR